MPDEFPPEIKALCEYIPEMPEERINYNQIPSKKLHFLGHDFSIVKVHELENKYRLKMIIHYEKKSGDITVDAEIVGGRTFISNRPYFRAENIKILAENAEIRDLKLCKTGD